MKNRLPIRTILLGVLGSLFVLADVLALMQVRNPNAPAVGLIIRDLGTFSAIVALALGFVAAVSSRTSRCVSSKAMANCALVGVVAHVYLGMVLASFLLFGAPVTYTLVLSPPTVLVTFTSLIVLQPVAVSVGFRNHNLERLSIQTGAVGYLLSGLLIVFLNGSNPYWALLYLALYLLSFGGLALGMMLGAFYFSISISAWKRRAWPSFVCFFGVLSGTLHAISLPVHIFLYKGLGVTGNRGFWCLVFLAVVVQPIWLLGMARVLWIGCRKNVGESRVCVSSV